MMGRGGLVLLLYNLITEHLLWSELEMSDERTSSGMFVLTDLTKTVLLAVFLDGRCRCKLGELLKAVTGHSSKAKVRSSFDLQWMAIPPAGKE